MKNFSLVTIVMLAGNCAFANLDWAQCSVVEVTAVNNSLLEEGLGSIYDMDNDGNSQTDSDSVTARVSIKNELVKMNLGQGGWNSASNKISVSHSKIDNGGETEEPIIDLEIKDGADTFIVRLFTLKMVGRVSYKKRNSKYAEHLATFDCSGVGALRDR